MFYDVMMVDVMNRTLFQVVQVQGANFGLRTGVVRLYVL